MDIIEQIPASAETNYVFWNITMGNIAEWFSKGMGFVVAIIMPLVIIRFALDIMYINVPLLSHSDDSLNNTESKMSFSFFALGTVWAKRSLQKSAITGENANFIYLKSAGVILIVTLLVMLTLANLNLIIDTIFEIITTGYDVAKGAIVESYNYFSNIS